MPGANDEEEPPPADVFPSLGDGNCAPLLDDGVGRVDGRRLPMIEVKNDLLLTDQECRCKLSLADRGYLDVGQKEEGVVRRQV